MASPNEPTPGSALPEQTVEPDLPLDTITLHVLSPSPEISGGRVTFPSIPLDTKISRLKSRIQNSMTGPAPPERQRLIYRGRPLLNMESTLRDILRSELETSTDLNPTFIFHLVITPVSGPMPAVPTPTSQNHVPQHSSTPPSGSQAQPASAGHHHHHNHQPHIQSAVAQAQAAQAMLQNQLSQLQQQVAITNMMGQAQGQGQGHRYTPNQQPQMPPFPGAYPNMQAFQATMMHQQQIRAHSGMHGMHNPTVNGLTPGMPFGQNPPRQIGPITTRVHETVGPDGQRTRVVVNETTFHLSRQPTPVPTTGQTEAHQTGEGRSQDSPTGPQLSPVEHQPRMQHETPMFPSRDELQGSPSNLHDFVPQQPAYQPALPNSSPETTSSTTVWLLSSPNGPQALVFAPGHGLFTNPSQSTHSSTRLSRPQSNLRFQRSPSGRIQPQNIPSLPTAANAHQQAIEAVERARNAAATARNAAATRQAVAAAAAANNDVLRMVLSRVWTFVKLYFVIFMFTEPGTWFRWISLLTAALVSVMPSTTLFRDFAAVLQARIDGLVPVPVAAAAAPAARQPQIEGRRRDGDAGVVGGAGAGARRQGEPDPAATAARLLQEHRQRHPNALRDGLEWAERAFGLFVASLIPGLGERHVRAREEARREAERLERERVAAAEEEEEEERRGLVPEEKSRGNEDEGSHQMERDSGEAASSASPAADAKEEADMDTELPLLDM